jgi:hypothetical protein
MTALRQLDPFRSFNSSGVCDFNSTYRYEDITGSTATPVPGGRLYHLRVNPSLGTFSGSAPSAQITVYDGNTPTPLTCSSTGAGCQDLTHQYVAKSADQISLVLVLPDNNTYLDAASATVEEAVYQ